MEHRYGGLPDEMAIVFAGYDNVALSIDKTAFAASHHPRQPLAETARPVEIQRWLYNICLVVNIFIFYHFLS